MRNVPDRGAATCCEPAAGNVAGSEAGNLAASGNVAAVLATFTLVNVASTIFNYFPFWAEDFQGGGRLEP